MTGYNAFLLYQAIKLHFTVESYDFFRYQKKFHCAVETFEKRRDRFSFHKLGRQYPEENDLIFFLAATFFTKPKIWVGEMFGPEATDAYMKRRRIRESLEYTVLQDLDANHIHSIEDLKSAINTLGDDGYPVLLGYEIHHTITPETLLVIDALTHCLDAWGKKIADTIVYPKMKLHYQRYAPFVEIDAKHFSQVLLTQLHK